MDKGFAAVTVACIAMLAFFIGYQITIGGSPKEATTDGAVDWDPSIIVEVTLKGDSIEASHSKPVAVNGNKATILFGGTYKITGILNDGRIIVYTNDKDPVKLILNGVNIRCLTGSPISIMDAEETFIILADGTENFVEDSVEYIFDDPAKNEPDAAIFCKSNLTIMGEGVLNVKGNYNDGITSKDALIIQSGTINVKSVDDGIRGRDSITVKSGVLNLEVGGDGLKSDNPENSTLGNIFAENGAINIVSGGDALQAEKKVVITGGRFNLKTGGGSSSTAGSNVSANGIKGFASVTIEGGVFEIDSADNALSSNGTATIKGGTLNLSSSDEAIHADNLVEITGGNINIAKCFEGIESATVKINDGAIRIISSNDGIDAVLNGQNSNSGDVIILKGSIEINADGDGIQAGRNVTIAEGDFVFTTAGGSSNTVAANASAKGVKAAAGILIKGGKFTISSADDAIHSNGAITVNAGTLALSSSNDAIHAEDSVEINGGEIVVERSLEGIESAIVTINGGSIRIVSNNESIDAFAIAGNLKTGAIYISNGIIEVTSGGDAIQAERDILITGGTFKVLSGGGSLNIIRKDFSAKGIKGVFGVVIEGGSFTIDSADDAIHSDGNVVIRGGLFILLTGDETIHGGGSVTVNGANINVVNSPNLGGKPWDTSTVVDVTLKDDSIEVSALPPVYVSASKIMIRSPGTYRITGTLRDGQIIVKTKDIGEVKLILNNAHINCSTNSPVCILDASHVTVFLETGTENVVSDGPEYVFGSLNMDEPNAAIYSQSNLTISGKGSLTVYGNFNDGIASKDGLVIEDGVINIRSVDDGIRGRDYLVVKGGVLNLEVNGDGLKSDNTDDAALGYVYVENGKLNIVSARDAITAQTSVTIRGGNFKLKTGGGSNFNTTASSKGIKSAVNVKIEGGNFDINSADDGVHSDGTITIDGGFLAISTGDDGIHADESITINNGKININRSYEGIEAPIITINDGDIHVVSSDDGVNLGVNSGGGGGQPGARFSLYSGNYYLYINGGYIAVNSSNGDGIDSNGAIVMKGGFVIVEGTSFDGNSALDHIAFNITAGYLVAVGSAGMAMPLGDLSEQYSVMLNFQTAYQAGTLVSIRTSNGTELFTFKPSRRYQTIIFSMPDLSLGSTYDVYIGGSHTGTVKDGLYSGGAYTPGTKYTTFTITSKVTQIGRSGWLFPVPR